MHAQLAQRHDLQGAMRVVVVVRERYDRRDERGANARDVACRRGEY